MKADRLFQEKPTEAGGAIMEMTIWRVPAPFLPSTHGLKYLAFQGDALPFATTAKDDGGLLGWPIANSRSISKIA